MRALTLLLLGCALGTVLGCDRPATQIVLRVDSDMRVGDELRAVQVTMRRTGADGDVFDQTFDLTSGQHLLPGTLGVVPGDPDDTRRLEVNVRALVAVGDDFSTRAVVSFQPEQTLMLDLYLAARCRDPANRAGCGPDETCGPNGCEPVSRTMLPGFDPDAARMEVPPVEEDVTVPEEDATVPEEDVTVPEEDATVPEEDVPIEEDLGPDDVMDVVIPCGSPGQMCCASGAACGSGALCQMGACVSCGGRAEPCCAGDRCNGPDVCSAGRCVACAGVGQPCCPGGACLAGGACVSGQCVACGALAQPCCGGTTCGAGLLCSAGQCVGCGGSGQPCCAGNVCAAATVCASGRCAPCGASGQVCCAGSACVAGTVCSGGNCAACGASGQVCCAGSSCRAGTVCSGGRCAACGGNGQPCCTGGQCAASANACVAVACTSGRCRHTTRDNGASAGPRAEQRCCNGAAVDISTNANHCGGCGMRCGSGTCEPLEAIPCGGSANTSGRCRCSSTSQCPSGRSSQQICRNQSPGSGRCAPENLADCAPGTSFFNVDFCPNYCRY